jgi:hypothetical protein
VSPSGGVAAAAVGAAVSLLSVKSTSPGVVAVVAPRSSGGGATAPLLSVNKQAPPRVGRRMVSVFFLLYILYFIHFYVRVGVTSCKRYYAVVVGE